MDNPIYQNMPSTSYPRSQSDHSNNSNSTVDINDVTDNISETT